MKNNLFTPTPAEAQRLAGQLTRDLLTGLPAADASMQDMLRAAPRTDPAVVTAIYFHAISLANDGWRE